MASNADLEGQKLMVFEVFANGQNIGLLADEDVEFSIESNVVKGTNAISGKATTKAWTGGAVAKITVTITEKNKDLVRTLYSHLFNNKSGESTNPTNGNAGTIEISSLVGVCLKPIVLTMYGHHTLCTTGSRYESNNLNPYGIQLLRAIVPEDFTWNFKSDEVSTQEIVFEGMPDFDLPNNIVGYVGYVNRPYFGLHILNTGTGYSTPPTIAIGTPFVASAVAVLGDYITTAGRVYLVTVGGTMSATAPNHTTGAVANGAATLEYVGTHNTYSIGVSGGKLVPELTALTATGVNMPSNLKVTITGTGTGATARLI